MVGELNDIVERVDFGDAVEIDVFGEWVAGEISREPLLDAKGERVRG
jgi:hypothetical protein